MNSKETARANGLGGSLRLGSVRAVRYARSVMRLILLSLTSSAILAVAAYAEDFDYYLLALTWTPSWCLAEGENGGQCDPPRDLGFSLHGLWPQYADGGWPEDCVVPRSQDPSRRQTAAMADIMGSAGLAWYEWKKHGRCTGLPAEDYFALARRAYAGLTLPVPGAPKVTAAAVETVLLALNPAFSATDVIVTCRDGRITEARICLTRDLAPRACGADVARDACRQSAPLEMPPVR